MKEVLKEEPEETGPLISSAIISCVSTFFRDVPGIKIDKNKCLGLHNLAGKLTQCNRDSDRANPEHNEFREHYSKNC